MYSATATRTERRDLRLPVSVRAGGLVIVPETDAAPGAKPPRYVLDPDSPRFDDGIRRIADRAARRLKISKADAEASLRDSIADAREQAPERLRASAFAAAVRWYREARASRAEAVLGLYETRFKRISRGVAVAQEAAEQREALMREARDSMRDAAREAPRPARDAAENSPLQQALRHPAPDSDMPPPVPRRVDRRPPTPPPANPELVEAAKKLKVDATPRGQVETTNISDRAWIARDAELRVEVWRSFQGSSAVIVLDDVPAGQQPRVLVRAGDNAMLSKIAERVAELREVSGRCDVETSQPPRRQAACQERPPSPSLRCRARARRPTRRRRT